MIRRVRLPALGGSDAHIP
ncbi:MAG: hypothetical protein KDC26_06250 [Armatimonadetes bacterium]|nr:hypothetical protein [Armatimonadota bacterium]